MNDIYCIKCNKHILKKHPNAFNIYINAEVGGHAQIPGGKCSGCGTEYNIEDKTTFATEKIKVKEKKVVKKK